MDVAMRSESMPSGGATCSGNGNCRSSKNAILRLRIPDGFCVEINGQMVADVSGEEVEEYLIANKLVQENDAEPAVPINAPCATEQHESAVRMKF